MKEELLVRLASALSSVKDKEAIFKKSFKIFSELSRDFLFLVYLSSESFQLKLIYPESFPSEFSWLEEKAESKEIFKIKRVKVKNTLFSLSSLSIKLYGKEIGKLVVVEKETKKLSLKKRKILEAGVKFLALGIKNKQAEDSLRKKEERLSLLSEVSSTVVSNRYLKEILDLIVVLTSQVLNSKICSVMLLDEEKEELFIVATQSLSPLYRNKPNLKVGQSISGKVVKEKRPITVLDVTKEPGYMYPEIARREGIISMLSVPMMIKDRAIGVINLYTDSPHIFTSEEIATLLAVANQSAVAIENTNLSAELLASKEALEVRKLIERAKGILIRKLKVGEEEAYRILQKKSMDLRKSMKEVSEAVILAEQVSNISVSNKNVA
ncbi:MAG: GAF and ANTAR domain-containing protein [Candidatus Omnitrophica bacterium]|nr:GAF and ANTAR domain-containing protein [Candidatus Omnitrophota bacterium]